MKAKAFLSVALLFSVRTIVASEVVVEDANAIWKVTLEHSAELISATSSVSPRILVRDSGSIYGCNLLQIPTDLAELTGQLTSGRRLIVDNAGSIYISNLYKVPIGLAEITRRLSPTRRIIVSQAGSTCRLALTFPSELLGISTAKGDVNGDDQIDVLDIVKIVNYITEKDTLSALEFTRADVAPFGADGRPRGDGSVDILDIVGINDMILHPEKHPSAKIAQAKPIPSRPAIVQLSRAEAGLLSLDIESKASISGLQLKLKYNPDETKPEEVLTTGRSGGMDLFWNASEGKLVVLFYSPGGETIAPGTGPVLRIRFQKKVETPSFVIEEIILSDPDANPVPVLVKGITSVAEGVGARPDDYVLFQNYPNPTNAGTNIRYGLPEEGRVRLAVYNTSGQLVKVLVNRVEAPGYKSVFWDGRDEGGEEVASGVYFYRLTVQTTGKDKGFKAIRKMLILR